jgi:Domain of unknown function (DUF4401)
MSRSISADALTDELLRRRIIGSDALAPPTPATDRPWFISIVLGFSGWLAGLFALGFVGVLFRPESAFGYGICGLVLLGAAYGLYAADRKSEFFAQLALALSIAGQIAVAMAVAEATDSETTVAALVTVMQIVILLLMPNDLAKVLAAFLGACAWALTIRFAWWGQHYYSGDVEPVALVPALLAWFLVWVPIMGAVHALVTHEHKWMAGTLRATLRPALTGLLASLCVATWASEPLSVLVLWQQGGRTNWLALWPLLGAAGAVFAAFYAFRLRNRALVGIAVIGAMLHVAQFYYVLGTTLLLKSGIMIAVGVSSLFAGFWLRQRETRKEARTA